MEKTGLTDFWQLAASGTPEAADAELRPGRHRLHADRQEPVALRLRRRVRKAARVRDGPPRPAGQPAPPGGDDRADRRPLPVEPGAARRDHAGGSRRLRAQGPSRRGDNGAHGLRAGAHGEAPELPPVHGPKERDPGLHRPPLPRDGGEPRSRQFRPGKAESSRAGRVVLIPAASPKSVSPVANKAATEGSDPHSQEREDAPGSRRERDQDRAGAGETGQELQGPRRRHSLSHRAPARHDRRQPARLQQPRRPLRHQARRQAEDPRRPDVAVLGSQVSGLGPSLGG